MVNTRYLINKLEQISKTLLVVLVLGTVVTYIACLWQGNSAGNNSDFAPRESMNTCPVCRKTECPACSPPEPIDCPATPDPETLQKSEMVKLKSMALTLKSIQSQTNVKLLDEIRTKWLKPPSQKPYNFSNVDNLGLEVATGQQIQTAVLRILYNKKNGFFVESLAFDGATFSNTLRLEKDFGWSGLLIEPDSVNYRQLKEKNRKAWSINACLGTKSTAEKIKMTRQKVDHPLDTGKMTGGLDLAGLFADSDTETVKEEFQAQCFPLATLLAAVGQSFNVDFLSLNLRGPELLVLRTVPWDFIYIKIITVAAPESLFEPLKTYLKSKNYRFVSSTSGQQALKQNLFVHNLYLSEAGIAPEKPTILTPVIIDPNVLREVLAKAPQ